MGNEIDLSSPYLPTGMDVGINGYPTLEDAYTTYWRDRLNEVELYTPTQPPVFNLWVRSYGPGVGDENYNVGYHHVPVASGNIPIAYVGNHEAPNIPVTHLPFLQALYNTTLVSEVVAGQTIYPSLRSPGINEGFS